MDKPKRNNQEKPALFKNPILEKITSVNSFHVIYTFIVLACALFFYGFFKNDIGWTSHIALLIFGWLSFSLIEYLMHRYLYHSGEYRRVSSWQYKIHGVHHDYPRDKDRLAMPLPLAIVVASMFYAMFSLFLGSNTMTFFPGFMLGYALYLYVHYKIHTIKPPQNVFHYLWIHHHMHHHQHDNKAFGVSTPLWDVVFRTMPPKIKQGRTK